MKKFDKYKNNNLPTRVFDEETQDIKYVYQRESSYNGLMVSSSLTDALTYITMNDFYYSFFINSFFYNKDKKKWVVEFGHHHEHTYEDVVKMLYKFPESFTISKDEEIFYSEQELQFLKRLKKYLCFIGMKDLNSTNEKNNRYINKLHDKYKNAYRYHLSSKVINEFIEGKRDFLIRECSTLLENKEYKQGEYCALLIDEEENYRLYVEITKEEIRDYKDVACFIEKSKIEGEKVNLSYFKILEIF